MTNLEKSAYDVLMKSTVTILGNIITSQSIEEVVRYCEQFNSIENVILRLQNPGA